MSVRTLEGPAECTKPLGTLVAYHMGHMRQGATHSPDALGSVLAQRGIIVRTRWGASKYRA